MSINYPIKFKYEATKTFSENVLSLSRQLTGMDYLPPGTITYSRQGDPHEDGIGKIDLYSDARSLIFYYFTNRESNYYKPAPGSKYLEKYFPTGITAKNIADDRKGLDVDIKVHELHGIYPPFDRTALDHLELDGDTVIVIMWRQDNIFFHQEKYHVKEVDSGRVYMTDIIGTPVTLPTFLLPDTVITPNESQVIYDMNIPYTDFIIDLVIKTFDIETYGTEDQPIRDKIILNPIAGKKSINIEGGWGLKYYGFGKDVYHDMLSTPVPADDYSKYIQKLIDDLGILHPGIGNDEKVSKYNSFLGFNLPTAENDVVNAKYSATNVELVDIVIPCESSLIVDGPIKLVMKLDMRFRDE